MLYTQLNLSRITLIFMVILMFTACDRDTEFEDKNYPAIINELSQQEINRIVNQVEQTPLWGCVSIDYFGFPIMSMHDECINPEWKMDFTENEIIDFAKQEFEKYRNLLNIDFPENINIQSITSTNGVRYSQFITNNPDSVPPVWVIASSQQKFNNIDVLGTTLRMVLSPNGAISLHGQWYSNIYIPGSEGYTEDEVREMLMGRTFTYSRQELIPNEETSWHASRLLILPVKRSGKIELHVCRAMYPTGWEILVDNYTGEVLSSIKIN